MYDDVARLDEFCTFEAAFGRVQSPQRFRAQVDAYLISDRGSRDRGRGLPSHGSPLEVAHVGSSDPGLRLELEQVWAWWDANVRGRLYESPMEGLGFDLAGPPLADAPWPLPDPPTAGDWLTASQQADWWAARRRVDNSTHARRQAAQWAQLRDRAHPVWAAESARVIAVIDAVESASPIPAAATTPRKAGTWA